MGELTDADGRWGITPGGRKGRYKLPKNRSREGWDDTGGGENANTNSSTSTAFIPPALTPKKTTQEEALLSD